MDVVSLTRLSSFPDGRDGLRDDDGGNGPWGPAEVLGEAVVANAHLCAQVAVVVGVSESCVRRAMLGESVRLVLGVAGWLLYRYSDEEETSGDLIRKREALLTGWAERRGRGVWRKASERRVERCECGTAPKDRRRKLTASEVEEMADEWCVVCRGSGVRLKALRFPSGDLVAEAGRSDERDGDNAGVSENGS